MYSYFIRTWFFFYLLYPVNHFVALSVTEAVQLTQVLNVDLIIYFGRNYPDAGLIASRSKDEKKRDNLEGVKVQNDSF